MPIHKYKNIIGLFLLLAIVSLVLFAYNKPANFILSNYHVNELGAHFIALSLLIPYLLELSFAVIAYLSIRIYSDVLGSSKEHSAFNDFRSGQFFLTLNIAIAPLLSGLVAYARNERLSQTIGVATVARYANLIILIYAALLFYRASTKLLLFINYDGQRLFLSTLVLYLGFALLFMLLGARYIQHDYVHQQSLLTLVYPVSFDGSGAISVFTVVIPRLIAWFLMVLAVQNFVIFQRYVKGTFYKKAFFAICCGIVVSIVSVAGLRAIQLLPISQQSINPLTAIMLAYFVGIIGIIGFGLYALGVNKLYAIEKV